jgi:succinate dehydrogenase/fumarate reductase flavoprotein subunit
LHWEAGYPKGAPYNTGDGIKMAQAIGADLWHMGNVAGHPGSHISCTASLPKSRVRLRQHIFDQEGGFAAHW